MGRMRRCDRGLPRGGCVVVASKVFEAGERLAQVAPKVGLSGFVLHCIAHLNSIDSVDFGEPFVESWELALVLFFF